MHHKVHPALTTPGAHPGSTYTNHNHGRGAQAGLDRPPCASTAVHGAAYLLCGTPQHRPRGEFESVWTSRLDQGRRRFSPALYPGAAPRTVTPTAADFVPGYQAPRWSIGYVSG